MGAGPTLATAGTDPRPHQMVPGVRQHRQPCHHRHQTHCFRHRGVRAPLLEASLREVWLASAHRGRRAPWQISRLPPDAHPRCSPRNSRAAPRRTSRVELSETGWSRWGKGVSERRDQGTGGCLRLTRRFAHLGGFEKTKIFSRAICHVRRLKRGARGGGSCTTCLDVHAPSLKHVCCGYTRTETRRDA